MPLKVSKRKSIKMKLFYVPLIIVAFTIALMGFVSARVTSSGFNEEMTSHGYKLLDSLILRAQDNQVAMKQIERSLEHALLSSANLIDRCEGELSNAFLTEVAKAAQIDEVNLYDLSGKIIYSNIEAYTAWAAPYDHPVQSVILSKEDHFFEPIRPNVISKASFKYMCKRLKDGRVLQLGVRAEHISALTEHLSPQNLVLDFAKNDDVVYALFTGPDYKAFAHSNPYRIGIDLSKDTATRMAFDEKTTYSAPYFYGPDQIKVLDVIAPIVVDGEVIMAINIGLSLDRMNRTLYDSLFWIGFTGFVSFSILLLLLYASSNYAVSTIQNLNTILRKMVIGDYTEDISKTLVQKSDELGAFSQALVQMKEKSKEHYHLANFDALTEIANRPNIMSKLTSAIEAYEKSSSKFAVLIFDIDDFKAINDTHGHLFGDEVIKVLAQIVSQSLPENDTIGRLGGDEFIVLKHHVAEAIDVVDWMESLFETLNTPLIIDGRFIEVTISIGVSFYPGNATTLNALLQTADQAMYQAKEIPGNAYCFSDLRHQKTP